MHHTRKVFLLIFGIFLIILISARIAYALKDREVAKEEAARKAQYDRILDAASVKPTEITVNYTTPTSTGSPLIFGGTHYPKLEHEDAWNELRNVGATSIRTDFFLEFTLPSDITLADYKNNKNNIRDPKKWQLSYINRRTSIFTHAKERGLKTIGIVSYAPKWLTYSHTEHGVPMDWDIYEDLVKKAYSLYRNNLDYIEVWNEPTHHYFLDVKNSGMTPAEAYTQIFYHAAKAIREVDHEKNDGKVIPIGGPVGHNPTDTSVLEAILKDTNTRQYINFISYHNYVMDEPSDTEYKSIMKKYGVENLPIFLTEWNYDSEEKKYNPYKNSDLAITYTGGKFLDFLKMGLAGANYYSFFPVDETATNKGEGFMGIYKWIGNHAELLPQARSWQILSRDMGLGQGKSSIFTPRTDDTAINPIGFTNIHNEQGMAIVNASPSGKMVALTFTDLPINNYAKVQVYYASANNDAKTPVYEGTLKVENNTARFDYYLPDETVMGVKLTEDKEWFNIFNFNSSK